jgi:hypothetical protein
MNVYTDKKTSGYVSGCIISRRTLDKMKRAKGFKYISTTILANRIVHEEITEDSKCKEILPLSL